MAQVDIDGHSHALATMVSIVFVFDQCDFWIPPGNSLLVEQIGHYLETF